MLDNKQGKKWKKFKNVHTSRLFGNENVHTLISKNVHTLRAVSQYFNNGSMRHAVILHITNIIQWSKQIRPGQYQGGEGGQGACPLKLKHFLSFLDVRWAISRLFILPMFNITTPRRGGGQGACPLKLKHFLSFLDVRWAISRLSSFTMCNITTSKRWGGSGGFACPLKLKHFLRV